MASKRKISSVNDVLERSKVRREMTLVEMQMEAKRKAHEEKKEKREEREGKR